MSKRILVFRSINFLKSIEHFDLDQGQIVEAGLCLPPNEPRIRGGTG
jgi:hypothetical protein